MSRKLISIALMMLLPGLAFAQQPATNSSTESLFSTVHLHGQLPREDDGSLNYQNCRSMGIDWYVASAIHLSLDMSKVANPNQLPLPILGTGEGFTFDHAPIFSFLGIENTYGYLLDAGNGGVLITAKLANDQDYALRYIILSSRDKTTQYLGQMILSKNNVSCAIRLEQK